MQRDRDRDEEKIERDRDRDEKEMEMKRGSDEKETEMSTEINDDRCRWKKRKQMKAEKIEKCKSVTIVFFC